MSDSEQERHLDKSDAERQRLERKKMREPSEYAKKLAEALYCEPNERFPDRASIASIIAAYESEAIRELGAALQKLTQYMPLCDCCQCCEVRTILLKYQKEPPCTPTKS